MRPFLILSYQILSICNKGHGFKSFHKHSLKKIFLYIIIVVQKLLLHL